eukprot:NODE_44_length_33449_cov_1.575742.p24 type:complete len:196 gc:universal NODE_44_length_33449_cov_1.575742:4153-3566(-)
MFIFYILSTFASENLPEDFERVTYGSIVKLVHEETDHRLNSIAVNYASGSGQQVISAVPTAKDSNSYWLVRSGYGEPNVELGQLIKCNEVLRFQHVNTQKHLHSHYQKSPISKQQEVSGFGEENADDNWKLICDTEYWQRDEPVELFHIGTEEYLSSSESHEFGNPIQEQLEIFAASRSKDSKWRASEGIYVGAE